MLRRKPTRLELKPEDIVEYEVKLANEAKRAQLDVDSKTPGPTASATTTSTTAADVETDGM
jgi:Anaphase-promoting complex APC subunit CDC26